MKCLPVLFVFSLLFFLSVVSAGADTVPEDLKKALPGETEQLLEEMDAGTVDHNTLHRGIGLLWQRAIHTVIPLFRDNISDVVMLLAVVLFCGVTGELHRAAENKGPDVVPMAGALVITLITAGSLRSMIGMGMETLEQMDVFAKSLLPTLAAAVAACGGAVTAGGRQVITLLFSNVLLSAIQTVLAPLVYVYIAVSAVDAMLPEHDLKRLRSGIGKMVTLGLTSLLLLFTVYLTLSGAVGSTADATAVRLAKSAISGAVPVVGGILSDAAESVLAGAGLVRNAMGIYGMLGILAICLTPFLHLAVRYLIYKLTAMLASALGSEPLIELIDALGTAVGLVLAMVGSCAVLLLISVATSVSVVAT